MYFVGIVIDNVLSYYYTHQDIHHCTTPLNLEALRVPLVRSTASAPALAASRAVPSLTTALRPSRRTVTTRVGRLGRLGSNGGSSRLGVGVRVATTTTTDGSVEEGPGLAGGELDPVAAARVGDVAAAVGDPGDGGASARVLGLDVVLLAGGRLGGVLGGAAVGLEPLVAELTAH